MDVMAYCALGLSIVAIIVATPLAVNETVKIVRSASGVKKDMKRLEEYKQKQLENVPLTEKEIEKVRKIVERNFNRKGAFKQKISKKQRAELRALKKRFDNQYKKVRESIRITKKMVFSKDEIKLVNEKKGKDRELPLTPEEIIELEKLQKLNEKRKKEAEKKKKKEENKMAEKYTSSFKRNLFGIAKGNSKWKKKKKKKKKKENDVNNTTNEKEVHDKYTSTFKRNLFNDSDSDDESKSIELGNQKKNRKKKKNAFRKYFSVSSCRSTEITDLIEIPDDKKNFIDDDDDEEEEEEEKEKEKVI